MKIVLDTNVFISGIFFHGPPAKILEAWKSSEIQIILSKEILEEYQRVADALAEKYPEIDISAIIELIDIHGEIIDTERIEVFECEDPDDNKFLECAIASRAKLIVSGDKHLLKLNGYQEIVVYKPRDFVDLCLK